MDKFSTNRILRKILGSEDRFPLQQQLFHAIMFCIALVALMMGISDSLLRLGPEYFFISFSVSTTSTLLYATSRQGANFKSVITPYFVMTAIVIVYVWKMLEGFSGSLLLITVALSITIPMVSSGRMKRIVFLAQQGLIWVLYYLESAGITGSMPTPRTTDRAVTATILSIGCYKGISFMMKNHHNQKKELRRLNGKMLQANIQLMRQKEELEATIEEIRELNQLLSICFNCKKIRDDQGYWLQLDHYFTEHRDTSFSHGICPECAADIYGKYYDPENAEPSKKVG
ncbi:MAG: hypothetical protein JXR40_04835 [Pontiellaceae bacterium]|nr:hypothetical protein [Pontiellaceae bacterium]